MSERGERQGVRGRRGVCVQAQCRRQGLLFSTPTPTRVIGCSAARRRSPAHPCSPPPPPWQSPQTPSRSRQSAPLVSRRRQDSTPRCPPPPRAARASPSPVAINKPVLARQIPCSSWLLQLFRDIRDAEITEVARDQKIDRVVHKKAAAVVTPRSGRAPR